MRIFTYGIEDRRMDAVRWHFGKAEYLDNDCSITKNKPKSLGNTEFSYQK